MGDIYEAAFHNGWLRRRVEPEPREIFVFGSNLAGRHGKGAALAAAKEHGAIYGLGVGLQGNSYAIPTKDETLHALPLWRIKVHVDQFIAFAKANQDLRFKITPIGCGLAGYSPGQIAPMFHGAPPNCILPEEFKCITSEESRRTPGPAA
jgi:hypothetical protein